MIAWPDLDIHSPTAETARLADALAISPVLAQLLVNRGIDADEAQAMLTARPELSWPEPAFADQLRQLFAALLAKDAAIAIFGDYDADGLSGTAVLSCFLRGAGFRVKALLPTRSQGYGLNTDSLRELAEAGHALLITVDCGISNANEIAYARSLGLEVVITDHHGLPETLPATDYILHPAVLQIPELKNLSGAGMAWWLSALLQPAFPLAPHPEQLLDLAVLGTLADMTPLRGLNFALAKRGLQAIRHTTRPGLMALARLKNLNLAELTEDDLTFRMIPMLNAAGRIDSPLPALELLLSEDESESRVRAQELQEMNGRRQVLCQEVLADTLQQLSAQPARAVIVLASEAWLHGVLGITCSQLVEKFHKPVVLMAMEGIHAKASVRAPKGYHVLEALQSCDDLLVRYGGHEMAGGFTILCEQIDAFRDRFEQACVSQQDQVHKRLNVEMVLNPEGLSLALLQELRQLAPFGMGNPSPLFLSLNAALEDIKSDRKSNSHFFARLANGPRMKGWQMWDPDLPQHSHFDLVYSLEQTFWRDTSQLELTLQALRPHQARSATAPHSQPEQSSKAEETPDTSLNTSPDAPLGADPEADLPLLPGWFFDGETYWTLPQQDTAQTAVWEDCRRQTALAPGEGRVLYVSEHPADVPLRRGRTGQFLTLLLDQPPPPAVWPALARAFARIVLLPLRPLPEPPRFQDLWPILAFFQELDLPVQHPQELARRFAMPVQRAELCLRSLCDLGLLAYDKERYRIQYKNQLYDLRQSPTFQGATQGWQQRQVTASLWQTVTLERLKQGFWSGKAING